LFGGGRSRYGLVPQEETMTRVLVSIVVVALMAGCGAHRMPPVAPVAVGDLKPAVEDASAGLVGMRPDFSAKRYAVIVLTPFKVASSEVKDDEDARLAKDMTAYLQAQLVRRLEAAGIFAKVVDATASANVPAAEKTLRLEGDVTKLTEGSQAVRYFVGFGAGAAKAQIETRLVDAASGRVELVTADRRAAGMGIFGGDGRQFLTESMDQMAEGYAKLLKRLAEGGRPGGR
jgi:hypothetical protein